MEQDTNYDEAVADLLAQKNSTDGKREDVQVDERNRAIEPVRENRAAWRASKVEWWYSFRIRVKKTGTRAGEFRDQTYFAVRAVGTL